MRLYYNRERKPSGCMYSSIERPTEGRLNNWKTKEKMERYENTKHKRKPRTGIIAVREQLISSGIRATISSTVQYLYTFPIQINLNRALYRSSGICFQYLVSHIDLLSSFVIFLPSLRLHITNINEGAILQFFLETLKSTKTLAEISLYLLYRQILV